MVFPGLRILAICLLIFGASGARAGILKCKDAAGNVTYTQAQCPAGTRPADLPDGVTQQDSQASPSNSDGTGLSPRAEALRMNRDACRQSYDGRICREFIEFRQLCIQSANQHSPDCAALQELESAQARDFRPSNQGSRGASKPGVTSQAKAEPPPKPKNEAGTPPVVCSPNMAFEGTHESVRDCARSLSLPSTVRWAQVKDFPNESGPGPKWTGHYICLKFVEFPDAQGGTRRVRPYLTVQKAEAAPGSAESYVLMNLRTRNSFPTKQAAVEHGCALDE